MFYIKHLNQFFLVAEKARFRESDNDNLSSKQMNYNGQTERANRYTVEINSSRSTPVKHYPECRTQ